MAMIKRINIWNNAVSKGHPDRVIKVDKSLIFEIEVKDTLIILRRLEDEDSDNIVEEFISLINLGKVEIIREAEPGELGEIIEESVPEYAAVVE